MNTSVAASSVGGTATATFYAFKASRGEGRGEEVVVVALNSWLGKEEGWLDAKADVLNLPDGTVADLDPASVHKCYANLDPASWEILNVIACPPKPGAQVTRKEIVKTLKNNGTACVPWRFDRDTDRLVLGPVITHGESDVIRLFLTHIESGSAYPKDRSSSWQGITEIPTIKGWAEEDKQELSMIVSGRQPIDCFRFNSETILNDGTHDSNRSMKPVTFRVIGLSKHSSRHGSVLEYDEGYPSQRDGLITWNNLKKHQVRDRCDKPHPDGSLYLEYVGEEDTWSVVGR
jgi:hypothetical protein